MLMMTVLQLKLLPTFACRNIKRSQRPLYSRRWHESINGHSIRDDGMQSCCGSMSKLGRTRPDIFFPAIVLSPGGCPFFFPGPRGKSSASHFLQTQITKYYHTSARTQLAMASFVALTVNHGIQDKPPGTRGLCMSRITQAQSYTTANTRLLALIFS